MSAGAVQVLEAAWVMDPDASVMPADVLLMQAVVRQTLAVLAQVILTVNSIFLFAYCFHQNKKYRVRSTHITVIFI